MSSADSISVAAPLTASAPDRAGRMLFGHPAALTVLSLAAMWEIFAVVGMRAVLVYYLVSQLAFSEQSAVQVYGYSTSAAFFTALIGGLVADRYLGVWRAALLGAVLLGIGFFLLSIESLLYPGLTVVAIGSGLFKPTMLAQVGLLYALDDPRRDRAYNVYSVGCNLGATAAPLICGALGATYGWSSAFIVCGVGMIISVAILIGGRALLPQQQTVSADRQQAQTSPGNLTGSLLVLCIAWLAGVLFFAAYGQIGGTIALWTESSVDRAIQLAGTQFTIPAAWFQSLNPFLIFALVPLVNWLWVRDRRPVSPSRDLGRMARGALYMAVCFGILAAVAGVQGAAGAHPLWVVLAIVPFTLGELYLNTTGQSMFSRLAPHGMVSVFMGIWILTLMLGYAVSGWLGRIWKVLPPAEFFGVMVLIAFASALVLVVARAVFIRRELDSAGTSRD
jgi:proton-dependent oligopeptide transporter, POT family